MAEEERPAPKPRHSTDIPRKRPHDKPLSLYPMSEDDVLRKLVDAGPLPGKQRTKGKHHHGGAVTTPKSKPVKGSPRTEKPGTQRKSSG